VLLRHTPYPESDSLTQLLFNQVTVIQGDVADDKTIHDLVSRAVKEEGHLDVFFANVSTHLTLNSRQPFTLPRSMDVCPSTQPLSIPRLRIFLT